MGRRTLLRPGSRRPVGFRRARPAGAALLLGLVLLALASTGSALTAAPAQAASGRCDPGTGVTVVVDFGPLGGGTRIACDPGGAGRAATRVVPSAGFPLTYVSGQPFVCRISGKPGAGDESCSATPPADAYWGLFWSDGTTETWNYATVGVAGLSVPEGGSIGWRFEDGGADEKPGAAPTVGQPSAEPTQPPTSPSPTRTPGPSAPAPPSASPPAAGPAPATPGPTVGSTAAAPTSSVPSPTSAGKVAGKRGRSAHPSARPRPTGSAGPGEATEGATDDTAGAVSEVASPVSSDLGDGEGTGGGDGVTLLAAAAAVLLAAAAGVVAWRRRV